MGSTRATTSMLAVAVLVVGMVAAVTDCASPSAPTPAPDCDSILLTMADCLGYVQNGSTQAKPSQACCDGLRTVVQQSPICLCTVLKDSGSIGIVINSTRALELPGDCGVDAPPISACPGGSPIAPPAPAPQPPQSSPSPAPSPTSSPPQAAPSPSSPPQAPVQPPVASPPAPSPPSSAPTSGGGSSGPSPSPTVPPADDNNNSGANVTAVSFLVLCAVLGLALLSYH